MTVPFQVAVVMSPSCARGDDGGRSHQRRGYISRDCAVRQARQWPQVTMFSGVVDAPHSGQSTVSWEWARASLISFDRSSWMVWSPRQGQPRCASAQRPGHCGDGVPPGERCHVSTLLRCASPAGSFGGSFRGGRQADMSTCRDRDPRRSGPAPALADLRFRESTGGTVARAAGALRPGWPPRPRRRQPTPGATRSGDGRDSAPGQPCSSANVATACTRLRPSCSTSASQTVRCSPRVRTRAVTVQRRRACPGRR